ncbi:MAG: hypothetical protein LBR52_01615 [Prevotellaceae bacterium]|nr:hypothetical protein [Prevotellaceae bacterium]
MKSNFVKFLCSTAIRLVVVAGIMVFATGCETDNGYSGNNNSSSDGCFRAAGYNDCLSHCYNAGKSTSFVASHNNECCCN